MPAGIGDGTYAGAFNHQVDKGQVLARSGIYHMPKDIGVGRGTGINRVRKSQQALKKNQDK